MARKPSYKEIDGNMILTKVVKQNNGGSRISLGKDFAGKTALIMFID